MNSLSSERRLLFFNGEQPPAAHPDQGEGRKNERQWSEQAAGLGEKIDRYNDLMGRVWEIADDALKVRLSSEIEEIKRLVQHEDKQLHARLDEHLDRYRQHVLPIEREKGKEVYHLYLPDDVREPEMYCRTPNGSEIGPLFIGKVSIDPDPDPVTRKKKPIGILEAADDGVKGHFIFRKDPGYVGEFWVTGRGGRREQLATARETATAEERREEKNREGERRTAELMRKTDAQFAEIRQAMAERQGISYSKRKAFFTGFWSQMMQQIDAEEKAGVTPERAKVLGGFRAELREFRRKAELIDATAATERAMKPSDDLEGRILDYRQMYRLPGYLRSARAAIANERALLRADDKDRAAILDGYERQLAAKEQGADKSYHAEQPKEMSSRSRRTDQLLVDFDKAMAALEKVEGPSDDPKVRALRADADRSFQELQESLRLEIGELGAPVLRGDASFPENVRQGWADRLALVKQKDGESYRRRNTEKFRRRLAYYKAASDTVGKEYGPDAERNALQTELHQLETVRDAKFSDPLESFTDAFLREADQRLAAVKARMEAIDRAARS